MFFSVYPIFHYFIVVYCVSIMAASVDGHLPFLAACHCQCCWLCL